MPVSSGNVNVLSAVGSVTVSVVSKSFAVAPSNMIFSLIDNWVPEIAPLNVPVVAVIPALNVAAPASDISKVTAVISEPPSLPLNCKSLSDIADFIIKLSEEAPFDILPNSVPSSLNIISAPSASNIISWTESIVKSLLAGVSISAITGNNKVLFCSVNELLSVATVPSIAKVTVWPECDVLIPVPPSNVIACEYKTTEPTPAVH